jgi:virginiamycin B lyase
MKASPTRRHPRLACALTALAALLVLSSPVTGTAAAAEPTAKVELGSGTRATALTTGPDGNLWFAGYRAQFGGPAGNLVGRVDPATGQVAEFPLPPRPIDFASAIAPGPDGNLWFTELGANAIGRVTTAGLITEFPLPTPGSRPNAIVRGLDGAVWFTEEGGDRVGRITPGGAITEFPLPAGARPGGIALGEDGSLWVTEKGLGRIARLTPSGAITEFPLPDATSLPGTIVYGPDGNLWFTEEGTRRIGRIGTDGEIEEFRVPGPPGPRKLSLGPGGDLWFTAATAIGSLAPDGLTGRASCVRSRDCKYPIASLAAGPDGRLWFGTGTLETSGGGGTQIAAAGAPGFIGSFSPGPLRSSIGRHAGPVTAGSTSLGISCTGGVAGAPCRGRVRLLGRVPGGSAVVLLAQRRYRLRAGAGHRFSLPLTARARRLLAIRGGLLATASTTVSRGRGTSRQIVIRASFQRP